jgi:hypothetical protein
VGRPVQRPGRQHLLFGPPLVTRPVLSLPLLWAAAAFCFCCYAALTFY